MHCCMSASVAAQVHPCMAHCTMRSMHRGCLQPSHSQQLRLLHVTAKLIDGQNTGLSSTLSDNVHALSWIPGSFRNTGQTLTMATVLIQTVIHALTHSWGADQLRLAWASEWWAARPLRLLHLTQLRIDLSGSADSALCLQQAEEEESWNYGQRTCQWSLGGRLTHLSSCI